MSSENNQTIMDQRIFQCGLSVETVSVYLLCTGLADGDTELTLTTLISIWNGDESSLNRELNTLEAKQILRKRTADPVIYTIEPFDRWIT